MVSYEAAAACGEDRFQFLAAHRHFVGLCHTFENIKYIARTDFEIE